MMDNNNQRCNIIKDFILLSQHYAEFTKKKVKLKKSDFCINVGASLNILIITL